MSVFELAALGAAALWAISNIISPAPSKHLGAIAFNRLRMSLVFVMLALWVAYTGDWRSVESAHWVPIIISGFVGIFVGDSALFLTLNRLGPRRTSILYSMNAGISTILGWIFLGEVLSFSEVAGIVTVLAGVVLAIVFGKRPSQLHEWEDVKGPLWIGVMLGFIAALCQSLGSLIARPIMETGIDPVTVSAMRVGVAALCLNILLQLPFSEIKPRNAMTKQVFVMTLLSGFVAMALGMTFILFALSGGEVGIVSTLSATTPAILLPLIWWRTGEFPAMGAWFGAILVVAGSALIFSG